MATTMPTPAPHRRCHGAAAVWFDLPVSLSLYLALLLCLAGSAEAQSSSPSPPGSSYPNGWKATRFNPSMAIIIVVLISAFFFMGFFSIYIRQCSERADRSIRPAGALGARSRRAAARGLDPAVIQTFPTLVYADVKEHKIGKGALECAVCLSEFEDDDTLRLLPKCDHVFHTDCIDAWLSAHSTCPVCRANLSAEPDAATREAVPAVPSATEEPNAVIPAHAAVDGAGGDERHTEGAENSAAAAAAATGQSEHVAITIDVPPAPEPVQKKAESSVALSPTNRMARVESKSRLPWRSKSSLRPPRFPRSHSTGHSLTVVQPGEDCERYTLRLPDHIRRDIMAGKLQRSSSCAAFPATGEGSTRKAGYGGEGSSRGGGSIGGRSFKLRKWDWVSKSDRWAFFTRTFSMRISRVDGAAGEGSTRRWADGSDARAEGSVKPKRSPFDCLGSAGGGANDGASDQAAASTTKLVGPTRV